MITEDLKMCPLYIMYFKRYNVEIDTSQFSPITINIGMLMMLQR